MQSGRAIYILIWLCLVIELGSLSFLRKYFGIYASPVIFLLSSNLLVFFLLQIARQTSVDAKGIKKSNNNKGHWIVLVALFVVMVMTGLFLLKKYFPDYPIDPEKSDIIPQIKVLVQRFVSGEKVYAPVSEIGYVLYPTYLPMTWFPYIIANTSGLDYRIEAFLIFSSCVFLPALFSRRNLVEKITGVILPFVVLFLFIESKPEIIGWTVEPMIAGFYLLLLYGLYKKDVLLTSVALTCCLLSRYAVVLLLPFIVMTLFYFVSRKKTILIFATTTLAVCLFFVFPFLIHEPKILMNGYRYHTQAALAEWNGQSWQTAKSLPFQLSQGYGFAIFFLRKDHLADSLRLFQQVHGTVCFLVPLFFTVWYFVKGRYRLAPNIFLALLLNIYLVFFFAFIQIPYAYLFITPMITSATITILICFSVKKKVSEIF